MKRMQIALLRPVLACVGLALMSVGPSGCSSSDSYSDPYHGSGISTGASFYYGTPYPYYGPYYGYPYYGYNGPDYIVTPPPRPTYPGGELPVRPEQPIARPPGAERPSTLPAERPGTRPSTADSSRSRMPSAQPRMSTPSARPSIPSRSRGGGGRRGR